MGINAASSLHMCAAAMSNLGRAGEKTSDMFVVSKRKF